ADPEGAAEIKVAFGRDGSAAHREIKGRRDRTKRYTRAAGQRLQQHVPGTERPAVPARRRVQPCFRHSSSRLYIASDAFGVEGALCLQCDQRRGRLILVASLERCLQSPQFFGFHAIILSSSFSRDALAERAARANALR